MMNKIGLLVLASVLIAAIAALVIVAGGISGDMAIKIRPGRHHCPWQYGFQLLEVTKPVPPGCYLGEYKDGTLTKEWMCCNTDYWTAHTVYDYQWNKPYDEKYIKQKSGLGKYY